MGSKHLQLLYLIERKVAPHQLSIYVNRFAASKLSPKLQNSFEVHGALLLERQRFQRSNPPRDQPEVWKVV